MKRRWFQVHLSTAIVMMVVAGVLLWLNMPRIVYRDFAAVGSEPAVVCNREFAGWPWTMSAKWKHSNPADDARHQFPPQGPEWFFDAVVCNMATAGIVLILCGFVSESLTRKRVRRREARKP